MKRRRRGGSRTATLMSGVLCTLLSVVLCALSFGPARAEAVKPGTVDQSPKWYLLALGDSLAAGYEPSFGTTPPPIDPLTGQRDGGYPNGYASDLATEEHLDLVDLGCPGETTVSMTSRPAEGQCAALYQSEFGASSQLAAALRFLATHKHHVKLITIDIGVNDLEACISTSQVSIGCITNAAATLSRNLTKILHTLRAAMLKYDPQARLASMNYYDPYVALAYAPGGATGQEIATASLAATNLLNNDLASDYRTFHVLNANVASAFMTNRVLPLRSYRASELAPNIIAVCRLTWMCPVTPNSTADIHPNPAGYRTIAKSFEAVLNDEDAQ